MTFTSFHKVTKSQASLNRAVFFPVVDTKPEALNVAPLAKMKQRGFRLVLVASAPGMSEDAVFSLAKQLHDGYGIDYFLVCAHYPEDNCVCMPPSPYMIQKYAKALSIDLSESWMFSSSYTTVGMGRAAGIGNVMFVPPEAGALDRAVDRALVRLATTPTPPGV